MNTLTELSRDFEVAHHTLNSLAAQGMENDASEDWMRAYSELKDRFTHLETSFKTDASRMLAQGQSVHTPMAADYGGVLRLLDTGRAELSNELVKFSGEWDWQGFAEHGLDIAGNVVDSLLGGSGHGSAPSGGAGGGDAQIIAAQLAAQQAAAQQAAQQASLEADRRMKSWMLAGGAVLAGGTVLYMMNKKK